MIRLQLKLEITSKEKLLPLNYGYLFSSWIYRTMYKADPKFASWLHDNGYSIDGKKKFKLFTFSRLFVESYEIQGDRMELLSNQASFHLSFGIDDQALPFVQGAFRNQEFSIFDQKSGVNFFIYSIETLPEPNFAMRYCFKSYSPICISYNMEGSESRTYLGPDAANYPQLLLKNLVHKYKLVYPNKEIPTTEYNFQLIGDAPRHKLITIHADSPKETKIRGFIYNFQLKANPELLKIGYYTGFGERNSMGFGCVEVL